MARAESRADDDEVDTGADEVIYRDELCQPAQTRLTTPLGRMVHATGRARQNAF